MSKKILIGGAIALAILVVGVIFMRRGGNTSPSSKLEEKTSTDIILGVVKPEVYEVDSAGKTIKELKDEDILLPPLSIKVAKDGRAIIYFPDGSMARIEGGTTFDLREGSYDPETGKAKTSFFLSIGKIWSKVVELTTPDSSWEVETSNAVATVRGTAFASESYGGRSSYNGSENKVAIFLLDPKTRDRILDKSVDIKENTGVDIDPTKLKDILSGTRSLAATERKPGTLADWITKNQREDEEVNRVIENIKSEFKRDLLEGNRIPPRLRYRLRQELQQRMQEYLKEDTSVKSTSDNTVTSVQSAPSGGASPVSTTTTPKPVSLTLVRTSPALMPSTGFPEGQRLVNKAILIFSDGTKKDVTTTAVWRVIGPIGRMESPGTFLAELDTSVAEYGQSSGAIVATFRTSTGVDLVGQTPIFKVVAVTPIDTSGNLLQ